MRPYGTNLKKIKCYGKIKDTCLYTAGHIIIDADENEEPMITWQLMIDADFDSENEEGPTIFNDQEAKLDNNDTETTA